MPKGLFVLLSAVVAIAAFRQQRLDAADTAFPEASRQR
jgi:hypothetical protein